MAEAAMSIVRDAANGKGPCRPQGAIGVGRIAAIYPPTFSP
jgi:hypothetical protein